MTTPDTTTADLTGQNDAGGCLAIGADAGGSKLSVQAGTSEGVQRTEWPSINLRTASIDEVARVLAERIRSSIPAEASRTNAVCCIGAAGAGTDEVASALRAHLAAHLDMEESRVLVTSDAMIAIRAAFDEAPGIIVIAGTGSGCYARSRDGKLVRAGGWGPGLEDPGSGNELGRSAVKELLSDLEGSTLSAFSQSIADHLGLGRPAIPDVLDTFYHPDFSAASLAPVILDRMEEGDPVAEGLVMRQCRTLALQCKRLADSQPDAARRIALAGGLTNRDSYLTILTRSIKESLPAAAVGKSVRPPVEGAWSWARSMCTQLS